jgi:hypothetical protein
MKENIDLEQNIIIKDNLELKTKEKLSEENTHKINTNEIKSEPNLSKEDIKQIIKDYIAHTTLSQNYLDLIKTDPKSLFSSIDEKKIKNWFYYLKIKCPLTPQINQNKDEDILKVSLDNIRKRYPVINNDSLRTRVRECVVYPDYLDVVRKVLIYYCDKYNIFYKQGLNEIFGPLILAKYKIPNLTLTEVVNLGALIIDSFLPNYFYEQEIFSLRSGLGLFLILFKYHEPTVFNKLDKLEVNPEIYATNWLVTYISGKLNLINYFILWDEIIKIDDPLFIQFILIAVIKDKRELIINCTDNLLPTFLTSLTINSEEELKKYINIAKELRKQTPYSFRLLADKIGFLKKKNKDIKIMYEKYHPESLPAMPIFPSEVLYITYKSQINCINPNCKRYLNEFVFDHPTKNALTSQSLMVDFPKKHSISTKPIKKIDSNIESQEKCEKCDWGIEKTMQYILLDLRILDYGEDESDSDKTGFLPSMINVPQEELKSDDISSIMTNRFLLERGDYHFIFLTTSTDTFNEFESNYYIESITNEERKRMMFGLVEQKKIDKELDIDNAKKNLSTKEIFKLKEYDNMRKTLKNMIKHNFPYVGYVYGGFNLVHEESKKFNVELINHNEETCLLCNKEKPKNNNELVEYSFESSISVKSEIYNSLWKNKEKINYKNLDIFFNNPNNKLHLCVLKEYKKNDIQLGDVQILINLLFDKFNIEIYKFDNLKQFKDFESTLIIKNKKKKEYYDYGQKEDLEQDLELTLLEKVFILDMLSIKADEKLKNVIICEIRGEKKKSGFLGLFKKKEDEEFETLRIVFDFSSTSEAREFIISFKEMMGRYRQFLKTKKKKK